MNICQIVQDFDEMIFELDSGTRLGDFCKFFFANYTTKMDQMYVDFWAIFKNIHFQVKIVVASFWAIFGKVWVFFISTSGHSGAGGTDLPTNKTLICKGQKRHSLASTQSVQFKKGIFDHALTLRILQSLWQQFNVTF